MKTAVLVDGDFFLKRHRVLRPGITTPEEVAESLHSGVLESLKNLNEGESAQRQLYRIFFYDCPPLDKRAHNPITGRVVIFNRGDKARFREQFHNQLKNKRKVALRLGRLSDNNHWRIKPNKTKKLLAGEIEVTDLRGTDVSYDMRQKGVDMRIGLDIATLAYKKQVEQILLISGDSDFVPAAKLARREGIDFILDPMQNHINPDLFEHIDGLSSGWEQTATP